MSFLFLEVGGDFVECELKGLNRVTLKVPSNLEILITLPPTPPLQPLLPE